MYSLRTVRSGCRSLANLAITVVVAATFGLLGTGSALAIPSPELIVGSFVSVSQLFALGSVVLGGGAAYAAVRSRRNNSSHGARTLIVTAVGAFALLVISVGFNIYQYIGHQNESQARLESTLMRPVLARVPNPDVRELNFAQQSKHPLQIGTEATAKLLTAHNRGETDKYVFLDVREHAEQKGGSLPGAAMIRFPDMQKRDLDLKGKTVILFCNNGDRSSEAAEQMTQMGIQAAFISGGLEKWLVEGRPITGIIGRDVTKLRAIPNYPNRNVLIDTEQAKALVETDKAIFVDVRLPSEFAQSHIPGAINLGLRRMATDTINEHIAKLPKRPVILPCYDRRSCFYAEVLGYELSRAGHDVRGRYTLPWEYFIPRNRPSYLESWFAEQERSFTARAATYLASLLSALSKWTGIVFAILLLAVLSRLLVLPFSLKAERDQIRARAMEGELEQIKLRFKDDAVRRTRAMRTLYKRHGITPIRNLIALAVLPVMAVALLGVQELAIGTHAGFLWISDLAQRDPLVILPIVFGLLITFYVDLVFATSIRRRIVIWLVVLPMMVATGLLFSAAGNVYLIGSAALLLIQRMWIAGTFAAAIRGLRHSRLPSGVIPLTNVSELTDSGNKAYRLARMRAEGMPVPDGLVLTPVFLDAFSKGNADFRNQALGQIWDKLGGQRLAVRSSANDEDGTDHSFAGVFESVINVDRSELESAIAKVLDSFTASRVGSYKTSCGGGNVLIQRMVHAQYSGVLFTRDPTAGGLSMIELVEGTAENLVSGVVRPQTYRVGRITKMPFGKSTAPIDLLPLLQLGDQAERLFGGPQDIEWTYQDGEFNLVQSRDITRTSAADADAAVQDDFARAVDLARGAAPDAVVFGKNELSEMLPRPTPLSLSLMESLWASGGSVDLASRELGLSYRVEEGSSLLTTILGRLYIDKREEKARALMIGPFAIRRLIRGAERIERDFREGFLPEFLAENLVLTIADFEKLSINELLGEISRIRNRFVFDTHVAVDVVNIAAGVYLDQARRALEAVGIEPSALLGHIPETFEKQAIAEIAATQPERRRSLMLKHFGHRAMLDYELAEPRYSEDPNALSRTISAREPSGQQSSYEAPTLAKSLARKVEIARRFQTLKEDAKHHSLRELAVLRSALLTLDRRLGLEGCVFYLTWDEVLALNGNSIPALLSKARKRQSDIQRLRKAASLPSVLTAHDLEVASAGDMSEMHALPNVIRGTRVAGSRVVEGRARVISEHDAESGNPVREFCNGDIIVAAMVSPAWLPYFSRAGGFVSELGGWLSHPAILAREHDVTMVVGTEGISRIEDGDIVRIHIDGRVEVVDKNENVIAA